jgi:hypothetical protein
LAAFSAFSSFFTFFFVSESTTFIPCMHHGDGNIQIPWEFLQQYIPHSCESHSHHDSHAFSYSDGFLGLVLRDSSCVS